MVIITAIDKDELKQIILELPDNSPKLLEYLKEAKEKGWTDVVAMILDPLVSCMRRIATYAS